MAGLGAKPGTWTESRTLLITPGCDPRVAQSKWPAGMGKLLEDVWPHQVWPLLYFSHLELVLIAVVAACKGKCAEGRCWQGGQQDTVLNSFLAISCHLLPDLLLLTTCLDLPRCLTLQWDCSGKPLPSKLMSIPGETCFELSVQELEKYFTWKATVQSFLKTHRSSETKESWAQNMWLYHLIMHTGFSDPGPFHSRHTQPLYPNT